MNASAPEWIAVAWRADELRLWAMSGRQVLDHATLEPGLETGAQAFARDGIAPLLRRLTAHWGSRSIIACGLLPNEPGAPGAPRHAVPCEATPQLVRAPGAHEVWLVRGVVQDDPANLMQGEETQIAGLVAKEPGFDGVACLPGQHTRWARISAREICYFQSFMTGELYTLLKRHSVLRHSIGEPDAADPVFLEAAQSALDRPQGAYAELFQIHAEGLAKTLDAPTAAARLLGALVGLELAAAKPYWLGQRVAMIGPSEFGAAYEAALAPRGVVLEHHDASALSLAGLVAAWETLNTR